MFGDLTAAEFSRAFLAGFFVFVAAFYTIRILAAARRTGVSPVHIGEAGGRQRSNQLAFRICRGAILVACVSRVVWPEIDRFLVPIPFLWHPAVLAAGIVLLVSAFMAILYVHTYMAQDWRSGIDEKRSTALITSGPFAISRNPMFVSIQVGQLALFFSLPSLFTLGLLVIGVVVLQRQARLEEAHLELCHGTRYIAYRDSVPRWLPQFLPWVRALP